MISVGDRVRVINNTFSGHIWAEYGDLGNVVHRLPGSENYPPGILQVRLDTKPEIVNLTDGEVEKVSDTAPETAKPPITPVLITPRELVAWKYVCMGHDGPAIAKKMGIKHHGARLHLDSLYKKLQVSNRTQLALVGLFGNIPHPEFIHMMVMETVERIRLHGVVASNTGSV